MEKKVKIRVYFNCGTGVPYDMEFDNPNVLFGFLADLKSTNGKYVEKVEVCIE